MYDPAAAAFSSMILTTNASSSSRGGILPRATISARKQRGSSGLTGIDVDRNHIETTRRRVEEVAKELETL
jgi:hypothetical protein